MKKLLVSVLLAFNLYSYAQTEYEIILFETSVDEFDVFGSEEYEKHNRSSQDITEKIKPEAACSAKSDAIGTDTFEASHLIDGNMKTCWLSSENPKNDIIEIIIDIEENESLTSAQLNAIYFVNGWRKDLQTWKEYAKIKKASMTINELPYGEITFENTYKFQSIELEKFKIEKSKRYRIRFKILETYKGNSSGRVAISDIQLVGKTK